MASWLAILAATGVTVFVLERLAVDGARTALETALADHLAAQAGMADGALHKLPVELLAAMRGESSERELRAMVEGLEIHGQLRGLALLGPTAEVEGHAGEWIPLAAEQDLVAKAAAGATVSGPLYQDAAGALYQTAYRPLTGHPGWVVAVEGDAATLGAVDALARDQLTGGLLVGLGAIVFAGLLASWLSRPLHRLGEELGAARPGAPPTAVGDYGFREVRQVSRAARELLGAIQGRDAELQAAHRREVGQLTRMAAEIAHEVGNPLNAVSLSVERLATLEEPAAKERVLTRVRDQLGQLEHIVARLRDLTQPLRPAFEAVALPELVGGVAAEMDELVVTMDIAPGSVVCTDRVMLAEVLRNLLQNAAQSGAKSATVRLTTESDQIRFTVTDDGPGIPAENAELIFGWFHTTRAAGTGLGLPLSRRIVEALGGTLDLEQLLPATFAFSLPAGGAR